MKVSVITINRNNLDGLKKTVESVLSQTWKEFEYILVDGDSSDGSREYLKANESHFTYWISEPDNGVFQAMNKGIRMAKGDYFLFLNSGDYFVGSHVLEQVFSKYRDADLLLGQCNIMKNGEKIFLLDTPVDFTLLCLYQGSLPHQGIFISKTLFEKYGLYREDLRYMSDWEFFLRVMIMHNATRDYLSFPIADYNTDGMSSNPDNWLAMEAEKRKVYSESCLQYVIPDYEMWKQDQHEKAAMLWIWKKPVFQKMIKGCYNIAGKMTNLKKKKRKSNI